MGRLLRHKAKPMIMKVPGARSLLSGYNNYIRKVKLQDADIKALRTEISELKGTIHKLDDRNKEWEREVSQLRGKPGVMKILWPVSKGDLFKASFPGKKSLKKTYKKGGHSKKLHIVWVVPPMGSVSGGHVDIFRVIRSQEDLGHTCSVYFMDTIGQSSMETVQINMSTYPQIRAKLYYNRADIEECDAIFATNWYTAYPVFNYPNSAAKFYFVQDFEPYFEPLGSYYALAENTYRFGLKGITLGNWLSTKLNNDYGMKCSPIEFGYDPTEYFVMSNETKSRSKILFYARPVTPRRGFELGILALEEFHRKHPEYEINLLGWDVSPYDIPFPYVNHGILSSSELNKLYNACAAGLVLSFTNMSLLPLEMLAAGCVPVVNTAAHTQMSSYASLLVLTETTPTAIAKSLRKAISLSENRDYRGGVTDTLKKFEWKNSFVAFNNALAEGVQENE